MAPADTEEVVSIIHENKGEQWRVGDVRVGGVKDSDSEEVVPEGSKGSKGSISADKIGRASCRERV